MPKCVKCGASLFEVTNTPVSSIGGSVRLVHCAESTCQAVVGVDSSVLSSPLTLSRNTAIRKALLIKGEELAKLDEAIRTFASAPKYRIVMINDIERRNATLEHVLALENALTDKIKQIYIEAEATPPWRAISLSVMTEGKKETEDAKTPPNLFVSIEGPAHPVSDMNHQVNLRLAAMTPWYGWFSPIAPYGVLVCWGVVSLLIYALSKALYKHQWPAANIRTIIYVAGWIGLATLLRAFQNRYFPTACFLIGQEVDRYRSADNVRWVVFVGLILSVVAGVITNYLTN